MKNAIIAIRNLETNDVQEFTSKDAAAKAMKEFGLSRDAARAIIAEVMESGNVSRRVGFDIGTPDAFAASAPIPEGPHIDAEQAPALAKASKPQHVASHKPAPRLVVALFARAGFGFAVPA
jgi:hypothetical protein